MKFYQIVALSLILVITATPVLQSNQEQEQEQEQEQAQLTIVAPDKAKIGELVKFDVSESVADSFKWTVKPNTDDFLTYDDGARAVFSARKAGTYQFIIACAKGGTVDVLIHTVTVKGPPTKPTTNSLTEWVPYWGWDLPTNEAQALAENFRKVVEAQPETPKDWIEVTSEANKMLLGDRLDAWKPVLNNIGKALEKQAEQGLLTTPEQHKRLWLEIARGLEKI